MDDFEWLLARASDKEVWELSICASTAAWVPMQQHAVSTPHLGTLRCKMCMQSANRYVFWLCLMSGRKLLYAASSQISPSLSMPIFISGRGEKGAGSNKIITCHLFSPSIFQSYLAERLVPILTTTAGSPTNNAYHAMAGKIATPLPRHA